MEDEQAVPASASPHPWLELISDDEWAVYLPVIAAVRAAGIPFALGGAFALATHTGKWRNTKDLDFFVAPEHRERMIEIVTCAGLVDYYDVLEYDRGWIYRSHRNGTIVDVIWTTANRRAHVDEGWLTRGPELEFRGERARVIPVEELIWAKLYVFHRDRCDWTDVWNLLYAAGPTLDWEHLLFRLEDDALLLSGALATFAWLCPGRASALPTWLWERLPRPGPAAGPPVDPHRVDLLDSRPWFFALLDQFETPAL